MNQLLNKRVTAVLLAGTLTLAACGTDSGSTVSSVVESATDAAAAVEADLDNLQTAISDSEAADTLQDAFDNMRTEVTSALGSITSDGMIEAPNLSDEIASFQGALDDLGDKVTPELQSAWAAIKDRLESMMS